jgi:acetylornithine/succinyldiaminopimelate/putrescine aminotransferase
LRFYVTKSCVRSLLRSAVRCWLVCVECGTGLQGAEVALAERGVLCKETHDMVLRIAPPLVVSSTDLDWAVEQFAAVLAGS